jgi:hypothetical protein
VAVRVHCSRTPIPTYPLVAQNERIALGCLARQIDTSAEGRPRPLHTPANAGILEDGVRVLQAHLPSPFPLSWDLTLPEDKRLMVLCARALPSSRKAVSGGGSGTWARFRPRVAEAAGEGRSRNTKVRREHRGGWASRIWDGARGKPAA